MPFPLEYFAGLAFQPTEKTEQSQRWKRGSGTVGIMLWREGKGPYGCSVVVHGVKLTWKHGADPDKLVEEAFDLVREVKDGSLEVLFGMDG